MLPRLLLIEDEERFARDLVSALGSRYEIEAVTGAEEAIPLLQTFRYDLVLLDLYLQPSRMDGFSFLEAMVSDCPWVPVMLLTMEERADIIVPAMERGACAYAPKSLPFPDLALRIDACLAQTRLRNRVTSLEDALRHDRPLVFFPHPKLQEVEREMRLAAEVESTVLLLGETGTGKSVLAREIHLASPRREGPFVVFECAASAPNLVESDLFGTVRGAFTEARDRRGVAEEAHQGTLFLDELDKLDVSLQRKLLRLVEEREFRRLGSSESIRVDIRIVAASSRDLHTLVSQEAFLPELLSRFEVFTIRLPSLREIREVIPDVVAFYLEHLGRTLHKPVRGVSRDAMAALQNAPWPGNIRQLRNILEYAVIHCEGTTLGLRHLPESVRASVSSRPRTLREAARDEADSVRRTLILTTLQRNAWHVPKAAQDLGITPQGLRQMMKKLGIVKPLVNAPEKSQGGT